MGSSIMLIFYTQQTNYLSYILSQTAIEQQHVLIAVKCTVWKKLLLNDFNPFHSYAVFFAKINVYSYMYLL